MHLKRDSKLRLATIGGVFALSNPAYAEYGLNLVEPASELTANVFDLHMLTTKLAFYITVVVTVFVAFILVRYRRSSGAEADQEMHTNKFGVYSWLLVPLIVLGIDLSLVGPANDTLKQVEQHVDAELTVKVTGSQWKWTYDYLDNGVRVVSNLQEHEADEVGYLRSVDNHFVLPVDTNIRFLHTATDVLHAWWVPAIAIKKDSIPGYIHETSTRVTKEGTYYGQCAENCGKGHAYMPIVVDVISKEKFSEWVVARTADANAAAAEASADKVWSKEDLMARGEELYVKNCAACHQVNGAGLPPVFPALKGSAIALGAVAEHLDVVIKGKAGTAMAAWGAQLNDLEVAAIVTYERNAWGNDAGDLVQPADVKSAR
ncbi:MAG: cytochrome c oxidase subunit II [Pseudomonadales bacterium]|nr:cytochrome c oxidase subunit II [Pseudomonadales bacterium]